MKRVITLLLAFMSLSNLTFSQSGTEDFQLEKYLKRSDGYKYPNVIKINTLAIPFNNISMSYERGLIPRLSFIISAGYKYTGRTPQLFSVNGSTINANLNQITGFSITPEIRYYLKSCEDRLLEGFYVGLYGRYTNYSSGANFEYFQEGLIAEFYNSDVGLTEVGAGLQLGYQLVLWQRLNIDFMFFGPRYSSYNLIYEFDQNVSQEFLNDLSAYINEVIDRFGLDYEVELKQSGESRASNSFRFANMRFGIALGFAF
jgi:hypothetical protein